MEFMGFELYSDLTLTGCITYEWVPGAIIEREASTGAPADRSGLGELPEVHGVIQSATRGRIETAAESVTYNPDTRAVHSRRMK